MTREAIQQALEALETLARYENPETRIQVRNPKDGGPIVTMYPHKVASDAAAALRTALDAELEQVMVEVWQTPREWVGLTDEEVERLAAQVWFGGASAGHERFAKLIEAKLKEQNGG